MLLVGFAAGLAGAGDASAGFDLGDAGAGAGAAAADGGDAGADVADADGEAAGVVLRVRAGVFAVVLASSGTGALFFAEAVALVDAARVVFFTTGAGVSDVAVAAAAGSAFFLGLLAGAAAALVLFVLIFFFGTLAAVVLLAALAGFVSVEARRNECGLERAIGVMHRAHRPRRLGLRTRQDISAALSVGVAVEDGRSCVRLSQSCNMKVSSNVRRVVYRSKKGDF